MEYFPAPLEKLVEQFSRLPGIGGKSAQRLAFFVLGLPQDEAEEFALKISQFKGIRVRGLMCIPPISDTDKKIRENFDKMYKLFIDISTKKTDNIDMEFLSMGMSGDFEQAIESGSNIIRLGSILFGARNYN